MTTAAAIRHYLRAQQFPLLLFTMLGLLVLNAIPFPGEVHELSVDLVETSVLVSTMNLLLPTKDFTRYLVVLGIPAFVTIWLDRGDALPYGDLVKNILFACLFAVTYRLTVKELLRHFAIDRAHILGAVAAYLLMGFFWASLYQIIEVLSPHSFTHLGTKTTVQDLNYFSFVTMLTLGYGDIVPCHGAARLFAIIEAMAGQFFIAVLVGRIVGLLIGTLNRRNQ